MFYLYSLLFYELCAALFPGLISQVMLLFVLLIGLFFFFFYITRQQNNRVGYILAVFILLNVFFYILKVLSYYNLNVNYLELEETARFKTFLYATLSFYALYICTKHKKITEKSLCIWSVLFCLVLLVKYNNYHDTYSALYGKDVSTNNIGYSFACLIPIVMLIDRPWIRLPYEFFCIFMVFSSTKRGAIIIVLMAIAVEFIHLLLTCKRGKALTGRRVFLIIAGVLVCSWIAKWQWQNNDALQKRLTRTMEGDSSGRDIIISNLIKEWRASPLENKVLGSGYSYTLVASGEDNYAHNDYLEFLVNFGLLGVSIYVLFVISLGKQIYVIKEEKERMLLLLCFLSLQTKALTAGGCFGDSFLYFMMFGYFIAKHDLSIKTTQQTNDENSQLQLAEAAP